MKALLFSILVGVAVLVNGCVKSEDVELQAALGTKFPDCSIDKELLELYTEISNDIGVIVRTEVPGWSSGLRIKSIKSWENVYLDPCNLPEGVEIGAEIRYSGTWYKFKNSDNLNLDLFPVELSKVEIIAPAGKKR
jgi:hypothetical protein